MSLDLKKESETIIEHLKRGEIVLYPTDTVWGLGCDATNGRAIDKINALKNRGAEKNLICLVSDYEMLEKHVRFVPSVVYDILKQSVSPVTIIYDEPINVAENIIAPDNTLAIRVVKDPFLAKLIRRFKRPLVSTSANFSGDPTPKSFEEINPLLKEKVAYIAKAPVKSKSTKPSSIIKVSRDLKVEVIRK